MKRLFKIFSVLVLSLAAASCGNKRASGEATVENEAGQTGTISGFMDSAAPDAPAAEVAMDLSYPSLSSGFESAEDWGESSFKKHTGSTYTLPGAPASNYDIFLAPKPEYKGNKTAMDLVEAFNLYAAMNFIVHDTELFVTVPFGDGENNRGKDLVETALGELDLDVFKDANNRMAVARFRDRARRICRMENLVTATEAQDRVTLAMKMVGELQQALQACMENTEYGVDRFHVLPKSDNSEQSLKKLWSSLAAPVENEYSYLKSADEKERLMIYNNESEPVDKRFSAALALKEDDDCKTCESLISMKLYSPLLVDAWNRYHDDLYREKGGDSKWSAHFLIPTHYLKKAACETILDHLVADPDDKLALVSFLALSHTIDNTRFLDI